MHTCGNMNEPRGRSNKPVAKGQTLGDPTYTRSLEKSDAQAQDGGPQGLEEGKGE